MAPQIPAAPLVINGWLIFAGPLFLEQIEALILQVEAPKKKDPHNFPKKECNATTCGDRQTRVPEHPARSDRCRIPTG